MEETLRQLSGLLLGCIPTAVLLTLLYLFYKAVVHKPLTKVLAERHSRTEGALEKARADIAAAEARTAEYEQRLREARLAVFKRLEEQRQEASQKKSAALVEARFRAQEQVSQARASIEQDKKAAQASLETEAARLAMEIVRTVLRPVVAESPVGGR